MLYIILLYFIFLFLVYTLQMRINTVLTWSELGVAPLGRAAVGHVAAGRTPGNLYPRSSAQPPGRPVPLGIMGAESRPPLKLLVHHCKYSTEGLKGCPQLGPQFLGVQWQKFRSWRVYADAPNLHTKKKENLSVEKIAKSHHECVKQVNYWIGTSIIRF